MNLFHPFFIAPGTDLIASAGPIQMRAGSMIRPSFVLCVVHYACS